MKLLKVDILKRIAAAKGDAEKMEKPLQINVLIGQTSERTISDQYWWN